MKIFFAFVFLVGLSSVFAQTRLPRFGDYPVAVYHGKIHRPKWIRHVQGDEWRDSLNKLIGQPEVGFAGKYYVGGHSLGTGARYYSLTDLSTGRELDVLDQFATAEPIPKLRDGREYLTVIYTRANSRLLIAQYLVDYMKTPSSECRERSVIFDSGKIRPVTKTFFRCRKLD